MDVGFLEGAEGVTVKVSLLGSDAVISKTLEKPLGCGGTKCAYLLTDRWSLLLSHRRLRETRSGDNFTSWEQIVAAEVAGAEFCSSLGILNPVNTPCTVTLLNGATFKSYISRTFSSLEEEGIAVVDRKGYSPAPEGVFKTTTVDLSDPSTYNDLLRPFLDDLAILHANDFYVGGDTFSYAYVRNATSTDLRDTTSTVSNYTARMFAFDFQGKPTAEVTRKSFQKAFPISHYRSSISSLVEDVLYRELDRRIGKQNISLTKEFEGYLDSVSKYYYSLLEARVNSGAPSKRRENDPLTINTALPLALIPVIDDVDVTADFLSELHKPNNLLRVRELFTNRGIDFTRNQGEALVALVHHYPSMFLLYLEREEFPLFMASGNRARAIVSELYEKNNVGHMRLAIRHDVDRDVVKSVAYLRAFRQAVVDDRKEMAVAIAEEVKYPADLVADALDRDRGEKNGAHDAVLEWMKRRDEVFFNSYVKYDHPEEEDDPDRKELAEVLARITSGPWQLEEPTGKEIIATAEVIAGLGEFHNLEGLEDLPREYLRVTLGRYSHLLTPRERAKVEGILASDWTIAPPF